MAERQKENAADRESELRRFFGRGGFEYQPEDVDGPLPKVFIKVEPFQISRFFDISDVALRIGALYFIEQRSISEIILVAQTDVLGLLRPLVSVPDCPSLKIDDLPPGVLAGALLLILKSITPGNWGALGSEIVGKFGLAGMWSDLKNKMVAPEAQSSDTTN